MRSQRFVEAMRRLFSGPTPMLATVALRGGLAERFEQRPGVTLWRIFRDDRDALVDEAVAWLEARLDGSERAPAAPQA